MTKHTRISQNALRSSLPPPPQGSSSVWLGSEKLIALMTRTETALETSVYSPFNHLKRMLLENILLNSGAVTDLN
jgi:hypothetical protein